MRLRPPCTPHPWSIAEPHASAAEPSLCLRRCRTARTCAGPACLSVCATSACRAQRPPAYAARACPTSAPVPKHKSSEPPAAKESVREEGKTKLVPRKPTGDPVAALMKDATLRRGDIVVLPDSPKVFKGGRTTPHRLSDFEDVRRTKLVGEKTRRQLTAMPVQPSAPRVQPETAERRLANQDNAEGKKIAEQVSTTGSLPRKVGP